MLRKNWLAIAGFLIALFTLLVSVWAVLVQLDGLGKQLVVQNQQTEQQGKIASAQLVLDFQKNLDANRFDSITFAVENHPHIFPLLYSSGGQFSTITLEDYMNQFDTIGDLVRDKVINPAMAYDEFSYDVEKLYCNVDTQKDIAANRGVKTLTINVATDSFYSGFQNLAIGFLKQDNLTCEELDSQ